MSTVPECWHGDLCPWHKRGRCSFKHCAPPPVGLTGEDVPVEQQLQDLRPALQRLAAAVMWRDGEQLEPLGNTVFKRVRGHQREPGRRVRALQQHGSPEGDKRSARTRGTTQSSMEQATELKSSVNYDEPTMIMSVPSRVCTPK